MQQFIRENKLPISVTGTGFLVAAVLAAAPALMADSDAEILTKSNEAEIQRLSASLTEQTTNLQQTVDQQSKMHLASLDRLDNQVNILNKATGRLNQKQSTVIGPVTDTIKEFNQLKVNSQTRLTNLEKAVSRMHQRQQGLLKANDSTTPQAGVDDKTALRITNLEKAVTQLHISSRRATAPQAAATSETDIEATAVLFADTNSRVDELEAIVARLQQVRPVQSSNARAPQSSIRNRIESDLRLSRLERQMIRMETRLETFEGGNQRQSRMREDELVEQLIEIRTYIDSLLYEVNP